MTKYRRILPQLGGGLFITDGGIETTSVFHDSLDLLYFAAVNLLRDPAGWAVLRRYFRDYAAISTACAEGGAAA